MKTCNERLTLHKNNPKCNVDMTKKDLREIRSLYKLTERILKSKILKNDRESSDLVNMFSLAGLYILKEGKINSHIVDDYYNKLLDVNIRAYPSRKVVVTDDT